MGSKIRFMVIRTLLFLIVFMTCFHVNAQTLQPPITKKVKKVFSEHGRERIDNYFWLSDPADSNVINHLREENTYLETYLQHTDTLQEKLYKEIVSRIPAEDQSLPVKRNGYWYYSRFEEGKQYPLLLRRKNSMTSPEEVLLNLPAMAKGHQIFILRGTAMSANNQILAYGVDTAGDRRVTLGFRKLLTGKDLDEKIPNTSGSYAWGNDNKSFFYVLNDHTVRSYKLMKHILGTPVSADKSLYEESDSTYDVNLSMSKDRKFIFISSTSTNTTEESFLFADNPETIHMIQPRLPDVEYHTDHFEGDVFHIYTNKNAKNFKLVETPISSPGIANWKDVIPASDTSFLEEAVILKNFLVLQVKENGLNQIKYHDRKSNAWKKVDFGEEDYFADLAFATDEYSSDSIRYAFSSLKTPQSDYLFDMATGNKKLLKIQKLGVAYDPGLYETKRLWSISRDGVKVPISLVYRRDKFRHDGSRPLLLYAYGSYGANIDAYFSSPIISLLDRGVSYAIAHIRGGQELGREWFEKGRLLNKKNTFNDFVDAAQFLVNEKYTSPDKLFANGGSAGGMLMGAITNMRPDLFKGVLAEVPWMDVITDMFNTDLPLTTLEYDQWGDPNKEEYYNYLLTWSPLDNVKPAKYPAILATGGLNDTQVPYFSPAKWVAKVRENNLGTNPVLFKVNMGAGHSGESGRYERQKLTALKYAFILDQLGITD